MRKTNDASVAGTVMSDAVHVYSSNKNTFYKTKIASVRLSGVTDEVSVMFMKKTMNPDEIKRGMNIAINGEIQSRNVCENGKRKLKVFLYAKEIDTENGGEYNSVHLRGFLCKPAVYRETPYGRRIADLLIAVNRPGGKSDYIPCICWGKNAINSLKIPVGAELEVWGRMQSRVYKKTISNDDNDEFENRIAYELSVSNMEVVESEEHKDQVSDNE